MHLTGNLGGFLFVVSVTCLLVCIEAQDPTLTKVDRLLKDLSVLYGPAESFQAELTSASDTLEKYNDKPIAVLIGDSITSFAFLDHPNVTFYPPEYVGWGCA